MVLLCLAGVAPADIAADYALSAGRLRARSEAEGVRDDGPELEAFLRSRGTSAEHVIVELLQSVDMEERVRAGGAPETDIAALRARLLE
jgi:hypothetical protein